MRRIIHGLVLVTLGISILFPQVFKLLSWDVFKILLALYLVWVGLVLIFKRDKNKIEQNRE